MHISQVCTYIVLLQLHYTSHGELHLFYAYDISKIMQAAIKI